MPVAKRIEEYKSNGEFEAYAFPGGYPIFYITKDSSVLCPTCCNEHVELLNDECDPQWYVVNSDINYEDASLYCEHCNKQIEPAYGND